MAEKETLQSIAEHLILALQPLQEAVADLISFQSFMCDLGWDVESLPDGYKKLATLVDKALGLLSGPPDAATIANLLGQVTAVYDELEQLKAPPEIPDDLVKELPQRLFELLLVRYLTAAWPVAYSTLEGLGLVGYETVTDPASKLPRAVRTRLYYDQIPGLLADPPSIVKRLYGWGTSDLDFDLLARAVGDCLWAIGVPAHLARVPPQLAAGYQKVISDVGDIGVMLEIPLPEVEVAGKMYDVGLALLELQARENEPAGLLLQLVVPKLEKAGTAWGISQKLTESVKVDLRAAGSLPLTFGITLRPGEIAFCSPLGTPSIDSTAAVAYTPANPLTLFGHPQRSRLQLKDIALGLRYEAPKGDADLRFLLKTSEITFFLSAADLDSFFKSLLGGSDLNIVTPFELVWSAKTGLSFQGGAGLEVTAHPHLQLGPLTIPQVQLRLHSSLVATTPDLRLEAGLSLGGKLGPLAVSAEGIGLHLSMAFKAGNAGPFDIQGGFKPPSGLGIVVDAGPITGGGFLSFDHANGRYSGVLQLQVYEIAVKAIGLLDTRLPGGEAGFSFLIIITAEFTPIQLGFGFTLNGVGGLAGIHRTVVTDEIQSGIRKGTINQLLFPKDPVANAARLISDLRRIFPPAKNRYVFGPMAIIGWGTPTLVEAKVGILLELPDPVRLVLLGEVSACLPDKEKAIVELHISVLGILDFGRKTLSIDASLHDSRLLAFTLYGDMALRLAWGTPPSFAFSLGGLNPHFQPPPGFPTLRRLTLALCTGDNPRLSLQAYMALTSNTVQFGARAELYVNVGVLDLNVYGFVGFDVLINFSPFSFIADLGAMIAVRMGQTVLFGLRLEATLSGPTPWRVRGKAIFTFIVPIPVEFDETFGPARCPEPLPLSEPWAKLQEAIADRRNWSTSPLPSGRNVVSLAKPQGDTAPVLLDPMGQVTFRQKVLPFNRKITLFGHTRPKGASRYDLSGVQVGQKPAEQWSTVQDYFAPGQFEALSDAQKLSRPSFEKMDGGVTLDSRRVAPGHAAAKDLVYETIIVDAPWQKRDPGTYELKRDRQTAMTGLGAAARSRLKTTGNQRYMPAAASAPAVALEDEQYIIVSTADFSRLQLEANQPANKGAAFQTLDDLAAADPTARERWQVVPLYEVEAMA